MHVVYSHVEPIKGTLYILSVLSIYLYLVSSYFFSSARKLVRLYCYSWWYGNLTYSQCPGNNSRTFSACCVQFLALCLAFYLPMYLHRWQNVYLLSYLSIIFHCFLVYILFLACVRWLYGSCTLLTETLYVYVFNKTAQPKTPPIIKPMSWAES